MNICERFCLKHCRCKTDEPNYQLMSRQAHFLACERIEFMAFLYVVSIGGRGGDVFIAAQRVV